MSDLKISTIYLTCAGLLLLGACSKTEKTANIAAIKPPNTEVSTTPDRQSTTAANDRANAGGTVIETAGIHLEMVPEKEANQTHIDLFVQKSNNHESLANAKVVAQVQTPDGKQQSFDMKYDPAGKHYMAVVPGNAVGQYQVKVTADISGKKVDGRFNFDR